MEGGKLLEGRRLSRATRKSGSQRTRTSVPALAEPAARHMAITGYAMERGRAGERTGERKGERTGDVSTTDGQESVEGTLHLMSVAQRMADVPGLALLTALIRPEHISCVRFVESEATPLSILTSQGTLQIATGMDPTLQMMLTCGYLAGLPVDVHLKVRKLLLSVLFSGCPA